MYLAGERTNAKAKGNREYSLKLVFPTTFWVLFLENISVNHCLLFFSEFTKSEHQFF